jgi:AraC-like DNA-binding protein
MFEEIQIKSALSCFYISLGHSPVPVLHQHEMHEFYYALVDGGTQEIPGKSVPMRKGDLFFFPGRQLHIGNGSPKHPCGCIVLYVTNIFSRNCDADCEAAKILELLIEESAKRNFLIPLRAQAADSTGKLLEDMVAEQAKPKPGLELALKTAFQQLLLMILRGGGVPEEKFKAFSIVTPRQRMNNVCRFIEANYTGNISVTQLASVASMSRSHLHAVFLRETGKTLTQYINDLRCRHAAGLLRDTDLPIADIGQISGFACTSNFYRAFREYSLVSPRHIREQRCDKQ